MHHFSSPSYKGLLFGSTNWWFWVMVRGTVFLSKWSFSSARNFCWGKVINVFSGQGFRRASKRRIIDLCFSMKGICFASFVILDDALNNFPIAYTLVCRASVWLDSSNALLGVVGTFFWNRSNKLKSLVGVCGAKSKLAGMSFVFLNWNCVVENWVDSIPLLLQVATCLSNRLQIVAKFIFHFDSWDWMSRSYSLVVRKYSTTFLTEIIGLYKNFYLKWNCIYILWSFRCYWKLALRATYHHLLERKWAFDSLFILRASQTLNIQKVLDENARKLLYLIFHHTPHHRRS